MTRTIWHTLSSADWYQYFIPTYCYTINKAYPEDRIEIGITGKLEQPVRDALTLIVGCKIRDLLAERDYRPTGGILITENVYLGIPQRKKSVLNTLRFLMHPLYTGDGGDIGSFDYTIITDLDFLIFPTTPTHLQWHQEQMENTGQPFAGHHGPWKYPDRFEGGWKGTRERVAGGFFCTTPGFYDKSYLNRVQRYADLALGKQQDYRESDEVTLCNIIKESGYKVPPKGFPKDLRGIHLGDFRPDMKHRYTDIAKMATKLSDTNARKFLEMWYGDETLKDIVDLCEHNLKFSEVWRNMLDHIFKRGYR